MKQHTELTERIGFRNKRPDEQTDRRGELTAFGIVRRERRASEAPGSVTDASVRAMRSRFLRWMEILPYDQYDRHRDTTQVHCSPTASQNEPTTVSCQLTDRFIE